MNAISPLSFSRYANAFAEGLSIDDLRQKVPAVFAASAHESLSRKYTFLPTERVLSGLMSAGFVPVDARQAQSRKASPVHARHVVRLRRRFETVALRDAVPEVVFLNSHDGTSAYQLRLGLFRAVCTNGLIVSVGYRASINLAGARQSRWQRITRHLDHAADDCRWQALRRELIVAGRE